MKLTKQNSIPIFLTEWQSRATLHETLSHIIVPTRIKWPSDTIVVKHEKTQGCFIPYDSSGKLASHLLGTRMKKFLFYSQFKIGDVLRGREKFGYAKNDPEQKNILYSATCSPEEYKNVQSWIAPFAMRIDEIRSKYRVLDVNFVLAEKLSEETARGTGIPLYEHSSFQESYLKYLSDKDKKKREKNVFGINPWLCVYKVEVLKDG